MEVTGTTRVKNGYWQMIISYEDIDGKKVRRWYSTGLKEAKNKTKAKEMLDVKIAEITEELEELSDEKQKRNIKKQQKKNTVLFLDYIEQYIDGKKSVLSAVVYHTYKTSYMKRLREYYKDYKLKLVDVETEDIIGFYDSLRAMGLKENTIKRYSNVLNPALKEAKRLKIIPTNPHEDIPSFKRTKAPIQYYNKEDLKNLLKYIEGHKYELPIKIAVYYGLRRSEIIGLRWESIDFQNKTLSVNHKVEKVEGKFILSDKLKTESSNRTLPLFPEIEADLLKHKENIKKNMEYYDKSYNKTYLDYICVDDMGMLFNPDTLGHQFKKIIRKHGMKDIRFHDLRHSCASLMVANNVNMKQVQEWLGHSNYSTTADVYSHLDFTSKINSANTITGSLNSEPIEKVEEIVLNDATENEFKDLKSMMKEMKKLGITNVDEYIKLKKLEKMMNT